MTSPLRPRVLILQSRLAHYRVPIFNRLAKHYEIDLVCQGTLGEGVSPTFRVLEARSRCVGSFIWYRWDGPPVGDYDAIIAEFDLRTLNIFGFLAKHAHRTILYSQGYGRSLLAALFRRALWARAGAALVYTESTAQQLIKSGVDGRKVFSVGNTQEVHYAPNNETRRTFLHIGRPQARKNVRELLTAFAKVKDRLPNDVYIELVGPGAREAYGSAAKEAGIADRIAFAADVHDPRAISEYFHRAIAYVAPGHIGLSGPQAIGHSVPVVTRSDVEHGPEIEPCIDGFSARVYREPRELQEILVELASDQEAAAALGRNGRALYKASYTPEKMTGRMADAIEFVRTGLK